MSTKPETYELLLSLAEAVVESFSVGGEYNHRTAEHGIDEIREMAEIAIASARAERPSPNTRVVFAWDHNADCGAVYFTEASSRDEESSVVSQDGMSIVWFGSADDLEEMADGMRTPKGEARAQ